MLGVRMPVAAVARSFLLLLLAAASSASAAPRGDRPPSGSNTGSWQVTIIDLGVLPGGIYSSAYAINDTGKIVGMAYDATFALKRPTGSSMRSSGW